MYWYFLFFSAICDSEYNVFLKKTAGFNDFGNLFFTALFLSGSILGFKKGIAGIQLGTAMAVWSGVAVVGTVILDIIVYRSRIDLKVGFFMFLCIVSIIGLNYYSGK